jgi:adenylate cyclase
MKYLYLLLVLSAAIGGESYAQTHDFNRLKDSVAKLPNDSVKINLLIELGMLKSDSDSNGALKIYDEAKRLSIEVDYQSGLARAHHQAGNAYYFSTDYVMALEEWKAAEAYYSNISDLAGVANMLSNSGAIFYNQNELNKALELYLKALTIAEKIDDQSRIATIQQNIGALHSDRKAFDLALDAYLNALDIFKTLNYSEGIGVASLNAGTIYTNTNMHNQAMEMYFAALEHLRSTAYLKSIFREIGKAYIAEGDYSQGIVYLDSSYVLASVSNDSYEAALTLVSIGFAKADNNDISGAIRYLEMAKAEALKIDSSNAPLEMATEGLVKLYATQKDYSRAYENQQLLQNIRDIKYNLETNRKFNSLMFNFELEKKESEIELLSKEQELQRKEMKRQKEIIYGIAFGFLFVCVFAITVFVQRNKIKAGKKQSEELLLNILPEEVAEELKAKGHADAQFIEHVTVLFTDFKGFTALSELVTPKELVHDLHACFSEFDRICGKYGIEKIKTIGDAYMAAGGLPTPNTTHAQDVVNAALEMVAVVERGKTAKIAADLPFFEIRVGIHTGPVVAGIVGVKKFQYDIWGDTVNTASRMESSGEVGKVNISQSTYVLLKDGPDFEFEHRGKVSAKGKGEIDMYFAETVA